MNNRQQFEHRANTQIITLGEITHEFAEPERLRLQLSPKVLKKPFDIGSFAYVIRGKNESIFDDRGTPVGIESFVENRRELIMRLLETFVGQRELTVLTRLRNTEYLIDWLNAKGYRELFASAAQAQQAYREYTAHLNHQINHQKLKPCTGKNMQVFFSMIIELLYPEGSHHILAGAVSIIAERGSEEAARTAHVDMYRDVCLAIARQCSAFVLNGQSYPLVVSIRDYEVVGFPSNHGWVGPFKESPLGYNASARRIATVEEYLAASEKLGRKRPFKSTVKRALAEAKAVLDAANRDERYWHRLNVAGLAVKAYASLFLMITGATPTEFQQFNYADALDIEKSPLKKELSAVKFRASGKATLYSIGQGTGLPLLKEYLKLREWILNGATHERLFFSMPSADERVSDSKEFSEFNVVYLLPKFFKTISGTFLDPKVPRLSSRKMRKYKSLVMHAAGVSPSTVAATLNHSVAVNLSTYSEATPEQQEAEFGQFWQAMRHAAKVTVERSLRSAEGEITTATGHCDGFNQPIPLRDLGTIAIKPNCRTQYGCLYCEHYICHSDEEDLHKILSLQYVINSVRKVAPDAPHAEALYKELSIRVEFILEALAERSDEIKQLVEAIKTKVFEYGELTPFWESRLSRYEKMGVAF
ncbi:TPA: hypothetical protein ACXJSJ_003192 [Pseudomonas aeruginosa]|uniref:hypothetical protein n=1 Tax=Pseudomonas aeruginosa TaxID=287 RepID=UPI00053DFA5E|nr:hypothetical protein [Pseudomonas aeruginosa]MBV6065413.1 hypothetical protein [Pseudomonas aeruginosa]MBV6165806.1 hypothetical protein [Pseudomonas aeruginosa]MBV6192378.1 hypothetical protein [Pseudomonas aeruginosa]MBX6708226.1 hypothetical protein [Pseudomonas aeruginosa]MCY0316967.1 hypothetical protein [Pseudomonas aeruginosa]